MKLSLDWLKEYIDIDCSPEQLSHILTMGGLEVEGLEKVEKVPGGLEGLVIGEVKECGKHPGADRLSLTKVDAGLDELLPIVCGAPNVAAGQKVVVATVGAMLYPTSGDPFKIKKSKIRAEVSMGMICAEDEIGLGEEHDGIMALDTDLPNGTPAATYFDLKPDMQIEIGLTPNRADAASHYGTARDLKVLLDKPLRFPDLSEFAPDNNNLPIEIEVENTEACPRYTGVTVSSVKVGSSPEWLQNRLKAIGLSPINNVVDVTNYVLHGLGQPLHAFDAAKIKGNKVVVKTLPEGTAFTTLDEEERKLYSEDLMICNAEEGMCIAGVFGGIGSGVTEETSEVFIESAYFNPDYIRRSSTKHGLKTDASFRFERGTDPNITVQAAQYAALLVKEVAGGEISSDIVDIYPNPISDFEVKARYRNVDRLIGKSIDRNRIKSILTGLEMHILEEDAEGIKLAVPPYRVDVQREADVIEDILRIYGFNNVEISEQLQADALANFPEQDQDKMRLELSMLLAGSGANEIFSNSLTSPEYLEGIADFNAEANVPMLNQLSADLGVMRQSMVFSGLEAVAHNINRRQQNLKLFEFGRTYHKKGERKYNEKEHLSLFVTGSEREESWQHPSAPSQFHTLFRLVNIVLQRLGLGQYETEDTPSDLFQYGLQLTHKKKVIAQLGRIKNGVAKKAGVKQEVFYADLDWEALVAKAQQTVEYQEIPKFPEVRRDLSLVLDKGIKFAQVKAVAEQTERKLLRRMNVFSVYEGDNLEEGKKSYAISFILQDPAKTLKDKAIDKTMTRLMQRFEKELGAVIRK